MIIVKPFVLMLRRPASEQSHLGELAITRPLVNVIYFEGHMDSIGIEATSATSGDVHGLSIPAVIAMLFLVIILGIISSRQLRVKGLGVHHLFLKIALKRANEQLVGFVRSLDLDEMNLVMGVAPRRGEALQIDLSSLPGFPAQGKTVTGKVNRVKNLGENNHNFLVSVSLELPSRTAEVAQRLADYLRQLHA